jgi:hypothetical protein
MADITVTVPDEVFDRVAVAYHATWPDQTETPDAELIRKALTYAVKDTWVAYETAKNQNEAGPLYDEAAQQYNASRQQVDANIQAENQTVFDEAAAAFPGF